MNRIIKYLQTLIGIIAGALVIFSFYWVINRNINNNKAEQDNRVTLQVFDWASGNMNPLIQTIIDDFEKINPNIKIERQSLSGPYYQKLHTLISAGDPPDIFHLYGHAIGKYASKNIIMDIEEFVKADTQGVNPKLNLDDYYKLTLDNLRYDGKKRGQGKLYGLPGQWSPLVYYYNKDLFDKANIAYPNDDWTWDEFIFSAREIAKINEETFGAYFISSVWWWRVMLQTYGVDIYDEKMNIRWNDEKVIEVFEMYISWMNEERTLIPHSSQQNYHISRWHTNRIGLFGPEGRWGVTRDRGDLGKSKFNVNFDAAAMPFGTVNTNIVYVNAYFISSKTKHPKEAWEFYKYLSSEEAQKKWASFGSGVPTRKKIANSSYFLDPGKLPFRDDIYLRELENAKILFHPQDPRVEGAISKELGRALLLNTKSVRQALKDANDDAIRYSAHPLYKEEHPLMPWKIIFNVTVIILSLLMIYTIYRWWKYRPGKVAFKEETAGLLMISPWAIGFTVFTLFSMGLSLFMTVTKWSGMTTIDQAEWVGLQNFAYIFAQDSNIVSSFFVTLYYALLAIPVGQVASLAVALLMNNDVKGISFFRAAWYLPTVLSGIAMAILWSWIFAPDGGLMNLILEPILGIFCLSPPEWFGKDAGIFAVPGFVIMGLMGVGGGMLIYLAGLKAIPDSLYEAAKIDGAGNWQQFINVTLPMLSPIILFNVVVSLIGSFQVFTQAYIMTPGGGREGSTLFYVLYLFQQAFDSHEFGYASAMAWILFVIILTLTLISIKLGEKKVHYEGMRL